MRVWEYCQAPQVNGRDAGAINPHCEDSALPMFAGSDA
jgi:hypothetical protein